MEGRRARAPRRMEVDAPAGSGNFPPTKVGKPVGAGEEGSRRVSPSPVCLEQP